MMNNNQKKKSEIRVGGGGVGEGVEWWEGDTNRTFYSHSMIITPST